MCVCVYGGGWIREGRKNDVSPVQNEDALYIDHSSVQIYKYPSVMKKNV